MIAMIIIIIITIITVIKITNKRDDFMEIVILIWNYKYVRNREHITSSNLQSHKRSSPKYSEFSRLYVREGFCSKG